MTRILERRVEPTAPCLVTGIEIESNVSTPFQIVLRSYNRRVFPAGTTLQANTPHVQSLNLRIGPGDILEVETALPAEIDCVWEVEELSPVTPLTPVRINGWECRTAAPCVVTHVVLQPAQTALLRVVRNRAEIVCERLVDGMHSRDVPLSVALSPGDVLHLESEPETTVACHWYVQNLASIQAVQAAQMALGVPADGLLGPHTQRAAMARPANPFHAQRAAMARPANPFHAHRAAQMAAQALGTPADRALAAILDADLATAEHDAGVGEPSGSECIGAPTFAQRLYPLEQEGIQAQIAQMFEAWGSAGSLSPESGISTAIGLVAANAVDRMIATRARPHPAPSPPPKPRPTRKVRLGPTAAEPAALANPYLAEFNESQRGDVLVQYTSRDRLVMKYAWAVPNDAALDALAHLGPIVEVGAGTGYWAKLLRDREGPVGELRQDLGSAELVLLCWPPLGGELVDECLSAYAGSTLVLVGEGEDGCTGFSDQLVHWDEVERVDIPQWRGLHDYLGIWRRR